jgi:hypothetical protein
MSVEEAKYGDPDRTITHVAVFRALACYLSKDSIMAIGLILVDLFDL